jgi:hypothetical protein
MSSKYKYDKFIIKFRDGGSWWARRALAHPDNIGAVSEGIYQNVTLYYYIFENAFCI